MARERNRSGGTGRTTVDRLAQTILRELQIYSDEMKDEIEVAKEEVGEEVVTQLMRTSPKLTGDYEKGWTTSEIKGKVIIHNATDYQLTHLLEKGHANAKGGGRTPPKVHIAPAEDMAIEEFVKRIERAAGS